MTLALRTVLVVSHTHWDREWYKTAEAFRPWLVALIDELQDEAGPFLLDGQAIVLEDYLALRPERAAELSVALQRGTLEAGPWYVLADLLLPSGEALVRNLLLGRERLRQLRAEPPPVLYCPDSFGHAAAGPLLAEGFGLPLAVVWRGYGGRRWPDGDTVRWQAESGASVLVHHLPREGYSAGANLPPDDAAARVRWSELREELAPRARLPFLWLPHGADHHAPQRDGSLALQALARAAAPLEVKRAGLRELAGRAVEAAASLALPVIAGELRESPDYVWTLQGTWSARAHQKRRNAQVERLLVRDVEPWTALAQLRTGWDARAELGEVWRLLLTGHPHDTLCGCSIDDVAGALDARLDGAQSAAVEVRGRALTRLTRGAAEDLPPPVPENVLVVRNPAPRSRRGVADLTIDLPLALVPVGPGSAERQAPPRAVPPIRLAGVGHLQILSSSRAWGRDESPSRYPRNHLVERIRALGMVEEIPGFGIATYRVAEGDGRRRSARTPPHSVRVRGRGNGAALDNGLLTVGCRERALRITTSDGRTYPDVLGFTAEGERGDLYTHAAIPDTLTRGVLRAHRVIARGPLRGTLRTHWRVPVTARECLSATGLPVAHAAAHLDLVVDVELDAGAPFVRLRVTGHNTLSDHRLRLVIRSRIVSERHLADAAFAVLSRWNTPAAPRPGDAEVIPPLHPLHRFVTVHDATRGLTLVSDGLAEYEVADEGDVWVTLIRATGELSRADLAERPGHAGWPTSTPGGQCPGPFGAVVAVVPHGPPSVAVLSTIERVAEDVLTPLVGETLRLEPATARARVDRPASCGARLVGEGLRFEACKPAQHTAAVVVRCVNVTDRVVEGEWHVPGASVARLARLDETPLGALSVRDARVRFYAPPRDVVTILVSGGTP